MILDGHRCFYHPGAARIQYRDALFFFKLLYGFIFVWFVLIAFSDFPEI